MKAYIQNEREFDYPEDMERILAYLEKHGTLNISHGEVERLYRKYSEDTWCAGWVEATDRKIAGFAQWLSEVEV